MTELLPCPFCGEKPATRLSFVVPAPANSADVWCQNADCPVAPVVTTNEPMANARAAWNRRALDPTAIKKEALYAFMWEVYAPSLSPEQFEKGWDYIEREYGPDTNPARAPREVSR